MKPWLDWRFDCYIIIAAAGITFGALGLATRYLSGWYIGNIITGLLALALAYRRILIIGRK